MLLIAIFLILIGCIFAELDISVGKYESNKKAEGIYSMAFLNTLGTFIVFLLIFIVKFDSFTFSLASLPLFGVLIIFEFIQMKLTNTAIIKTDRSIFSLVKSLTIPLLIIVDIFLGYSLSIIIMIGCVVMFTAISIIFLHHDKKINIYYTQFSQL